MPNDLPKPEANAGLAAGIIHVAPDGSILLLHRSPSEENYAGHWALPGGKADDGETPEECADRECREETGYKSDVPLKLLDQRLTPNGMAFHTFARPVFEKFSPKLNDEHSGHIWATLDKLPHPLHPAVARTIEERIGDDGAKLQKWAHAGGDKEMAADADLELAFDRAPDGVRPGLVVTLAFDKDTQSVRAKDNFERLHVKRTPITKAGVNEYYGREIPKARELGLEPDRKYRLLRHPDEIEKAAATFNNLPLLSKHVPHAPEAHDGDITVGTVGSEAEFEHPYLYNSLGIWSREGIDHVESGSQKELSSAYSYDADMTPGVYEGEPYDGVMRNMKGNHVALVKKGRAGSDVVVGDEALQPSLKLEIQPMKLKSLKASVAYGALTGLLRGVKLAQDASIDLTPALAHVKPKKFSAAKPKIIAGVKKALEGKLAQDADLAGIVGGVEQLLNSIDKDKTVEDEELTPNDKKDGEEGDEPQPVEMDEDEDEDELDDATTADGSRESIVAYLKSKGVPEDVIAGLPGETAEDAGPDTAGPGGAGPHKGKSGGELFDKGAMDEAIRNAENRAVQRVNAINAARDHVKPIVGEMKMAFDSVEGVYRQAFKMQGRDVSKIKDPEALKAMWDLVPVPGARPKAPIAQDSGDADDFATAFPNMAKVRKA